MLFLFFLFLLRVRFVVYMLSRAIGLPSLATTIPLYAKTPIRGIGSKLGPLLLLKPWEWVDLS